MVAVVAPLVPVLVAGGGIALVAATTVDAPVVAPVPRQLAPSGGSTIAIAQSQLSGGTYTVQRGALLAYTQGLPTSVQVVQSAWGYTTTDPALRAKLLEIEAAAKRAHDQMSAAAKTAAAEKLNAELHLDPPLKGTEDWATISRVAGGTAAAAACAATGVGASISSLCALAGAYLGEKLSDLIAKGYDELKSYLGDKWGDVKTVASDAWSWFSDKF